MIELRLLMRDLPLMSCLLVINFFFKKAKAIAWGSDNLIVIVIDRLLIGFGNYLIILLGNDLDLYLPYDVILGGFGFGCYLRTNIAVQG